MVNIHVMKSKNALSYKLSLVFQKSYLETVRVIFSPVLSEKLLYMESVTSRYPYLGKDSITTLISEKLPCVHSSLLIEKHYTVQKTISALYFYSLTIKNHGCHRNCKN